MSLIIRLLPGESVTLDGMTFAAELDPPTLLRESDPPILIPIHPTLALPGVTVHLARRQHNE